MTGAWGGGVPGFLGRVLDAEGSPWGTCFQVGGSVLVTAWHVLVDAGVDGVGDTVLVDSLVAGGAGPVSAEVVAGDVVHDLAVLRRAEPLPAAESRLAASGAQGIGVGVVVTGHGLLDDPGKAPLRHTDAPGAWAGGAMREDAVSLALVDSKRVLRGMSGAPVRRLADGVVVGVVSARYNSADGWFRDSVWVARIEDLQPLLVQVPGWDAPALVDAPKLTGAADLDLMIDDAKVRLVGAGVDATVQHQGISFGLVQALADVRSARARAGAAPRAEPLQADSQEPGLSATSVSLRRAGTLLAQSFLLDPLDRELTGVLNRAAAAGIPVRIGVQAAAGFTQLPWEALPDPVAGTPLALHRLVTVYRKVPAGVARAVSWPLRIVVAIAAPTAGGGGVLDYERELRMVHRAVREARGSDAMVRVVPFATTTAIHEALSAGDVHVLHMSGHGGPGVLILENEDGQARRVTAQQFLKEAVPAGCMPAVISLAACYTDAPAADGAASFAADLAGNGAAAVIATETSVTDRYATRVFARTYKNLAAATPADVVAALAQARREVHRELAVAADPRDREVADLDEWGTVTVLAGTPVTVIGDPAHADPRASRLDPSARSFRGLPARPAGEFVGRRVEQHQMPRVLLDENEVQYHGVLLAGIGGAGKTMLAVEVLRRVVDRDPNRMVVTVVGATNVDQVLTGIADPARRALLMAGQTGTPGFQAAQLAGQVDLPWQDRWLLLREHLLDHQPVVLVLDNFEDNLTAPYPDGHRRVRVDNLADLIADIITDPGQVRLLLTCRHPFRLPREAQANLWHRHLGPLTPAETMKMVWGLPRLDALDDTDIEHIWRVIGGHPRTLEYLDSLLAQGQGRFPDISKRLTDQVRTRLGDKAAGWLTAERDLDAALADAVTIAADDILLPDLLQQIRPVPDAEDALLGLSVYRLPVEPSGLLFQIGELDPDAKWTPDRQGAQKRITAVLAPHGLGLDTLISLLNSGDSAQLPDGLLPSITHDLQELYALPRPGRRWPRDPEPIFDTLTRSSLITIDPDTETLFVHRWTASELARIWCQDTGGEQRLRAAHRQAAHYWQWRVQVWPQDRADDIDDLMEARYHLLEAGDTDQAVDVTEGIVTQLHTWGAWDRETALVHHTLTLLPGTDPRRAAWYHQLGILAQNRGEYSEAERLYRQSLEINERLGNNASAANGYHQLGILALLRGNYSEAELLYRRSLEIDERIGNQRGAANGYGQMGVLALHRGDYSEAERLCRQSLEIFEGLGDQAGAAIGYHQLGILAQRQGDYEEAERRYRQSLELKERLGDQAGSAVSHHQLGALAHQRRDYEEAERRFWQSLEIKERLGDRAGTAKSYLNLGALAHQRRDYEEAERRIWQSLEIFEGLGDQAGAADGYHNMGALAQDRGDYEEAERRYRQSLELKERLGNRAGAATTTSQLGLLQTARLRFTEAVALHVQALFVRLDLQVPQARVDLSALRTLRNQMLADQFDAAALRVVDSGTLDVLRSLLDGAADPASSH